MGGVVSFAHLRRSLGWLLVLGAVALSADCSMIDRLSGRKEAAEQRAAALQLLQLKVMRFGDEYAGGVIEPIQRFQQTTDDPAERLGAQNWMITQATSAYTIASGPNPVTNALDMVVLATLSRMVIEDAWVGERYGDRALPLRDAHRRLEPRARALLTDVLTPTQNAQLDQIISDWRAQNPNVRAVAYVHFTDFAKSIGRPTPAEAESKGGLFQFLGLDPMSNIDPAVREITQTRQLAERTIYYAQRAPNLLDMQIQRLTYQMAAMPETKRMLADVDRFGGAAASAGHLADDLPTVLAREREAAIRQFVDAINAQTTQMRGLVTDLRGTLEAGTATSNSLNETVRSVDQLMGRFQKPKPPGAPPEPPGRPFDIREYTAAAAEFARTANELQQLVASIEHGTPVLAQTASSATADLQNVIDHALWRVGLLVLLLLGGGLVTVLAYRVIARRWLA
jgi:hypothetical protein